ncbi:Holliday junction branch migration protein RuvA [uncultured Megasphaera sp.]|uniref:Holliday junction branch migration protein RuvA n=1 Tax=uncultured Megasphaera sp. TaxID=165188 RepID=UPI0012E0E502|nr:Holliday junction branch migration protein RuvA [uncultured Megasphaera sp.]MUP47855.1 Holliday junction branch migration protein RuvA [Veillonellaceae bacterium M2-8]MUP59618.1 Holliday junction branch migration protein RuvA [Veillonellaceae bacterium M2-4]
MIGYVRGVVTHLFEDACFVDVQGVGYRVYIPASTIQEITVGKEIQLFTYMAVREDAILLYGFATTDEYELFMLLISVNGVGPKVALGILSAVTPEGFRLAVQQKQLQTLVKLPGIGKKTGERILLELQDKVGKADAHTTDDVEAIRSVPTDEVVMALVSLGYSEGEAHKAAARVTSLDLPLPEQIRRALQQLGGGNT